MEYLKICSYQPTQLQGGDTSPFEPNSQLSKGSFCWHFWQNCQVSDTKVSKTLKHELIFQVFPGGRVPEVSPVC